MIEVLLAGVGLIGGFLITLGWYKRGLTDMEKDLSGLENRIATMEKESHGTRTDLEVIKQRIGYMESKIDEIHSVIMRPIMIAPDK